MDSEAEEDKAMEMCEEKSGRKRKPVDIGDEGSDSSSRESNQQWDVDSFDEEIHYKPRRIHPDDEEGHKLRRYRIQMFESNGFNVEWENYPGRMGHRELLPVNLDLPFQATGIIARDYLKKNVDLALAKYNKINNSNLLFDSVVKATISAAAGIKLYITFKAKETPDGHTVEYQAKTHQMPWQTRTHALFCRPTPPPKVIQVPSYDEGVSTESSTDPPSSESGQEWDKDSMEEESDYQPPKQMEPSDEEIPKLSVYKRLMHKSKGFYYVDGQRYNGETVYFSEVALDKPFQITQETGLDFTKRMANLALEKYNDVKKLDVKFHSIVRALLTKVDGFKLYITFMAIESPGEDPVEYQAKTEKKVYQSRTHVILCRPTPKSQD